MDNKPNSFKYVENRRTIGVIEKMKKIAELAGDSLNGYVGKLFKKHINETIDE